MASVRDPLHSNSPQFMMNEAFVLISTSTTTPDDQGGYFPKDFAEIIELAWVILDGETLEEVRRELTQK